MNTSMKKNDGMIANKWITANIMQPVSILMNGNSSTFHIVTFL